jgi:hypothetical protein
MINNTRNIYVPMVCEESSRRITSQEGTIKEQGRTDQHFPIAMH